MDSPIIYRLLADLVLATHVAFVLFVILGLILTLVGGVRGWQWVRSPLFRAVHLAAIVLVVLQAWLGIVCPLTTLENALRARAGQASYPGSFIAYWLRAGLYYRAPPWVFTVIYTIFASLVAATWLWVRPQPFRASPANA